MTTEKIRKAITEAIANAATADQVARLEVAREYLTNPAFRTELSDYVWRINHAL